MSYETHYNKLIEKAKIQTIEGYSERHHIFPKSMGGSDDPQNIVRLTPKQHYVAHHLLAHMYGGKMWYALWRMSINGRYKAKAYEISRVKHAKQLSKDRTGRKLSVEHKAKISKTLTGGKHVGMKRSEQSKINMSIAQKNKPPVSNATRERMRKANITHKIVQQIDDKNNVLRVFHSIKVAAETMNVSRTSIQKAINTGNKSCGFYWQVFNN